MQTLNDYKITKTISEKANRTIALATDYDCWHPDHDSVTSDQVLATLFANIEKAKKMVLETVPRLPTERICSCPTALKHAVATDKLMISDAVKTKLKLIWGK